MEKPAKVLLLLVLVQLVPLVPQEAQCAKAHSLLLVISFMNVTTLMTTSKLPWWLFGGRSQLLTDHRCSLLWISNVHNVMRFKPIFIKFSSCSCSSYRGLIRNKLPSRSLLQISTSSVMNILICAKTNRQRRSSINVSILYQMNSGRLPRSDVNKLSKNARRSWSLAGSRMLRNMLAP